MQITPICLDFINKCLQYDPEKRFDWKGIEAHPFYNHRHYFKILQKVSYAVSYDEQGSCQMQEISNHFNLSRVPPSPMLQNRLATQAKRSPRATNKDAPQIQL